MGQAGSSSPDSGTCTSTAREVGVLAGSDASDEPFVYAGASLPDELALLVAAGLTPLQALRASTLNPAEFLGRDDGGTVAPGNLADLVLLDADPLVNITNTQRTRAVVLNGQLLDRPTLDAPLERAEAAVTASERASTSGGVTRRFTRRRALLPCFAPSPTPTLPRPTAVPPLKTSSAFSRGCDGSGNDSIRKPASPITMRLPSWRASRADGGQIRPGG